MTETEYVRNPLKITATPLTLIKMSRVDVLMNDDGALDNLLLEGADGAVLDFDSRYGHHTVTITLSNEYRATINAVEDMETLLGPVFDRTAPTAFTALWTLLLLEGTHKRGYGIETDCGDRLEFLHLTSCGLDPRRSSTPDDNVWSEWGGTFAEDSYVRGLSGMATCRCGAVKGYGISMSYEDGIAAMMKKALDLRSLLKI